MVEAVSGKAADRLAAARARLILDRPFLGALVLRLPLVAAGPWCRTTASDARCLYYNPRWIEALAPGQVQFVLAHEALHCALGHFARRGHRVKQRWDLACDLAVNPLLAAEGLTPPAEALVLDLYAGMAAEEIYPCLEDNPESETLDDHVWDGEEGGQGGSAETQGEGGGSGRETDAAAGGATPSAPGIGGEGETDETGAAPPPPLGAREREQLQQQWQRHLAAAAQRAREAGKLAGALARLVETTLAPQVSWRSLLAQYLMQTAREDYGYQRPSRREGELILPSLRSRSGELVVALDVSGSLGDDDIGGFLAELDALKGSHSVAITLLACDAQLAADGPWRFEPWDPLRLPRRFPGGGGTDFRPVFAWVADRGLHPDALIYFTDAEGEFPPAPPPYPVLFLVKGKAPVPWGRRLQLN